MKHIINFLVFISLTFSIKVWAEEWLGACSKDEFDNSIVGGAIYQTKYSDMAFAVYLYLADGSNLPLRMAFNYRIPAKDLLGFVDIDIKFSPSGTVGKEALYSLGSGAYLWNSKTWEKQFARMLKESSMKIRVPFKNSGRKTYDITLAGFTKALSTAIYKCRQLSKGQIRMNKSINKLLPSKLQDHLPL